MSVLLLRNLPYIAAVLFVFGLGSWTGYKAAQPRYNRLQADYSAYRLVVADAERDAEKHAREALQAQIDQQHAVDRHNEQVMSDLRKRTADAESHYDADRAAIRGLLNAASKAGVPPGHQLSGGESRLTAASAGQASGVERATELCANLAAEDEWNANQLDSLNAQIKTQ